MPTTGVYGDVDSPVARGPPRGDVVHRAGESLGERVSRIVQREVARRPARPRDLLHVDRSTDLDRPVAPAVQHSAAAQRVWLSATGPGSHQPSAPERPDHEPSSLIRTGSTLGGAGHRRLEGANQPAIPRRRSSISISVPYAVFAVRLDGRMNLTLVDLGQRFPPTQTASHCPSFGLVNGKLRPSYSACYPASRAVSTVECVWPQSAIGGGG